MNKKTKRNILPLEDSKKINEMILAGASNEGIMRRFPKIKLSALYQRRNSMKHKVSPLPEKKEKIEKQVVDNIFYNVSIEGFSLQIRKGLKFAGDESGVIIN